MKMMNSEHLLTEIPSVEALLGVKYALILPHTMPDGDTVGSSVALFLGLKLLGIQSWIVLEDQLPRELRFLGGAIISPEQYDRALTQLNYPINEKNAIAITVDLSDLERLQARKDLIGDLPLWNIDHHITNLMFGHVKIIDSNASSTGELMFKILKTWNVSMTKDIAEALYVAITTDTGSFKYTNTTAQTHRVVADILDVGIDRELISLHLYHSEPSSKLKLHAISLGEMKIYPGGRVARAYVTQTMLLETGAHMTEADGLVERIRDIDGIDTVILIKEISIDQVKVSMRSIGSVNVAKVALNHGGGGHKNAAGFSLSMSLEDALEAIDLLVSKAENFEKKQTFGDER